MGNPVRKISKLVAVGGIHSIVATGLEAAGIEFEYNDASGEFRAIVEGDDLPIELSVSMDPLMLRFKMLLDLVICPDNYSEVFRQLNGINSRMRFGIFVIDEKNAKVFFRYEFPYAEARVSSDFVELLVKYIIEEVDSHDGELKMLAEGETDPDGGYMRGFDMAEDFENDYREEGDEWEKVVIRALRGKAMMDIDGHWCTKDKFIEGLVVRDLSGPGGPAGLPMDSTDPHCMYIDTSECHNLIIGGSGSGKSRRIIMQQVLTMVGSGESAVIFDPKGEICAMTNEPLAADGYSIHVMDLRNPLTSSGWNMFEWPYQLYKGGSRRDRDKAFETVISVADTLCPVLSIPGKDPYWESSAQGLLAGLIWNLIRSGCPLEDITLPAIFNECQRIFQDASSIEEYISKHHNEGLGYMMMSPSLDNAENTRRCILSEFRQHLLPLISSESLVSMLSRTDLSFKDIVNGKSVVYIIAPDEKDTLNPVVSIFVKMLYEYLLYCAHTDSGRLGNRMNFILDEFASLPMIKNMPSMLAAARSRNIRFTITLQSMSQLKSVYGPDADTIKGNCANWIFLSSRDMGTLEEISALVGNDATGGRMISTSQLQRLDKSRGQMLVLRDRKRPYLGCFSDISDFGFEPKPIPTQNAVTAPSFEDESMDDLLGLVSPGREYSPSELEVIFDFFNSIGAIGNVTWMLDALALLRDNPEPENAAAELKRVGFVFQDDEDFRASMVLCRRVLLEEN
jgi:type IV secretion system protein VirD4